MADLNNFVPLHTSERLSRDRKDFPGDSDDFRRNFVKPSIISGKLDIENSLDPDRRENQKLQDHFERERRDHLERQRREWIEDERLDELESKRYERQHGEQGLRRPGRVTDMFERLRARADLPHTVASTFDGDVTRYTAIIEDFNERVDWKDFLDSVKYDQLAQTTHGNARTVVELFRGHKNSYREAR